MKEFSGTTEKSRKVKFLKKKIIEMKNPQNYKTIENLKFPNWKIPGKKFEI